MPAIDRLRVSGALFGAAQVRPPRSFHVTFHELVTRTLTRAQQAAPLPRTSHPTETLFFDRFPVSLVKEPSDRARIPRPDPPLVDGDERHDLLHRAGQERLIGSQQLFQPERRFTNIQSLFPRQLDNYPS